MSKTPILDKIEIVRKKAAEEAAEEARRIIEGNPTGLDAATERKLKRLGLGKKGPDGRFQLSIGTEGEQKG